MPEARESTVGASAPGVGLQPGTLAARIKGSRGGHDVVQARLTTDERVLARVTDGIYREPSSALRELVSNAYDADASEVVIQTDRPRFSSISVTDNGNGMSPEVVAHVIEHIGGSSKRTASGAELNVTQTGDPLRSPGGRRLIGRIGIGLFSVSQLTHAFQIITKTKGDPWRTVASVRLRSYDDESAGSLDDEKYEAGLVSIWRVEAKDVEASGTTIILTDLQRHAVRTLSDRDRWVRVANGEPPPAFHIGRLREGSLVTDAGTDVNALPWDADDSGESAFRKLVDAVWDQLRQGRTRNPSVTHLFDKYLQTVWDIALAAPLPYVGSHPLNVGPSDVDRYVLAPDVRSAPSTLPSGSLADALGVSPNIGEGSGDFRVYMDNLELRRPLRFEALPHTSHALKKPIVFAGHVRDDFAELEVARSGGPLEFTGYLMWAPKIAPIEHNGVLIRVHGASGTLFDRSFLQYGIAEISRLRQLSCEIFVSQGFEAALNIDREGFNQAHPHARRITAWLHAAVGRAINTQKALANEKRRHSRSQASQGVSSELERLVSSLWRSHRADGASPPSVRWADSGAALEQVDSILLNPERVFGGALRRDVASIARQHKLAAIAQILAAFDLLEQLPKQDLQVLMSAINDALRIES